MKNTNTFIGK